MESAMQCLRCGAEMNHHADKPVEPLDAADTARVDPVLGVLIEEMYACPACGCSASRTPR